MRLPTRTRWDEYRALLNDARESGYTILGLDEWVTQGYPRKSRTLLLRHDVDQQPASALKMASVEDEFNIRATWYFRWRTAHPRVIASIAGSGASIGLHYETLTRAALALGTQEVTGPLIERSRETLRREVELFEQRFGTIRSICPHGDTRVPWVANHLLVRGLGAASFGVMFDGNEVMRGRRLGGWITDRRDPFLWKDGIVPRQVFAAGVTPVLAVVHPHHWSSRLHAGLDRALRVPPLLWSQAGRWSQAGPVRSGADEPPL